MKLYHYTSLVAFQNIWKEKRLNFSECKTTNDAFERSKSLRINGTFISECMKVASEEEIKRFINAIFSEIESYKQISLCVDYNNELKGFASPMMWGQYARSKNTRNKWIDGVCIELDDDKITCPSENFYRGKVNYDYKVPVPVLDGVNITSPNAVNTYIDKNQSLLFFSKHIHWEHENEYRLVCKGQDSIDVSNAITGIYVLEKDSLAFKKVIKIVDDESLVFFLNIGGFDGIHMSSNNVKLFNQLLGIE
jgi:hypothetical protein